MIHCGHLYIRDVLKNVMKNKIIFLHILLENVMHMLEHCKIKSIHGDWMIHYSKDCLNKMQIK